MCSWVLHLGTKFANHGRCHGLGQLSAGARGESGEGSLHQRRHEAEWRCRPHGSILAIRAGPARSSSEAPQRVRAKSPSRSVQQIADSETFFFRVLETAAVLVDGRRHARASQPRRRIRQRSARRRHARRGRLMLVRTETISYVLPRRHHHETRRLPSAHEKEASTGDWFCSNQMRPHTRT